MQTIIRVKKDKENPYVVINKGCLNDTSLSLKAKGLLSYLLSLPDDWQIYVSELENHHKDGKASISSAIQELIRQGYCTRTHKRGEKGFFINYEYTIYENKCQNPHLNRQKDPETDSPELDNPELENPQLLYNNLN